MNTKTIATPFHGSYYLKLFNYPNGGLRALLPNALRYSLDFGGAFTRKLQTDLYTRQAQWAVEGSATAPQQLSKIKDPFAKALVDASKQNKLRFGDAENIAKIAIQCKLKTDAGRKRFLELVKKWKAINKPTAEKLGITGEASAEHNICDAQKLREMLINIITRPNAPQKKDDILVALKAEVEKHTRHETSGVKSLLIGEFMFDLGLFVIEILALRIAPTLAFSCAALPGILSFSAALFIVQFTMTLTTGFLQGFFDALSDSPDKQPKSTSELFNRAALFAKEKWNNEVNDPKTFHPVVDATLGTLGLMLFWIPLARTYHISAHAIKYIALDGTNTLLDNFAAQKSAKNTLLYDLPKALIKGGFRGYIKDITKFSKAVNAIMVTWQQLYFDALRTFACVFAGAGLKKTLDFYWSPSVKLVLLSKVIAPLTSFTEWLVGEVTYQILCLRYIRTRIQQLCHRKLS